MRGFRSVAAAAALLAGVVAGVAPAGAGEASASPARKGPPSQTWTATVSLDCTDVDRTVTVTGTAPSVALGKGFVISNLTTDLQRDMALSIAVDGATPSSFAIGGGEPASTIPFVPTVQPGRQITLRVTGAYTAYWRYNPIPGHAEEITCSPVGDATIGSVRVVRIAPTAPTTALSGIVNTTMVCFNKGKLMSAYQGPVTMGLPSRVAPGETFTIETSMPWYFWHEIYSVSGAEPVAPGSNQYTVTAGAGEVVEVALVFAWFAIEPPNYYPCFPRDGHLGAIPVIASGR